MWWFQSIWKILVKSLKPPPKIWSLIKENILNKDENPWKSRGNYMNKWYSYRSKQMLPPPPEKTDNGSILPWKLTISLPKSLLSRWFSFSSGGIYDRSLEGIHPGRFNMEHNHRGLEDCRFQPWIFQGILFAWQLLLGLTPVGACPLRPTTPCTERWVTGIRDEASDRHQHIQDLILCLMSRWQPRWTSCDL